MKLIKPILFLFAFALVAMQPLSAQSWNKYKSDICKCKVKLPGEIEVDSTVKELVKTYKVSTEFQETVYFFGYSVHEVPLVDHEEMANLSLESFGESLGAEPVSSKDWEVKKQPGKAATFKIPDQDAVCLYRVVLIDQIQYQMVVLGPRLEIDDDIANTFFDSFKPKKPKKKK